LIPTLAALALAFVLLRHPAGASLDPHGPTQSLVLAADVRGDESRPLKINPGTVWIELQMDLVAGMNSGRWASYHWEVSAPNGVTVQSGDLTTVPLKLKLPASEFKSGIEYKLLVQGAAGTDPVKSAFVIDRQ
jgi:hypothetical protein